METPASNVAESIKITHHGQIAEMSLPRGWVEGSPYAFDGGLGTRSFRETHPPEDPDASLCFFYRGLPIAEDVGKSFKEILEKPPHVLPQPELKLVSEVLRDKSRPQ